MKFAGDDEIEDEDKYIREDCEDEEYENDDD